MLVTWINMWLMYGSWWDHGKHNLHAVRLHNVLRILKFYIEISRLENRRQMLVVCPENLVKNYL